MYVLFFFSSLDVGMPEPSVTHQPMVGFTKESFLHENYRSKYKSEYLKTLTLSIAVLIPSNFQLYNTRPVCNVVNLLILI